MYDDYLSSDSLPEGQELNQALFVRPGARLVCFARLALPVYRVDLECLVLARKELGTINEFLMKSIEAGLVTPAYISSFLGLEPSLVDELLGDLQAGDQIYYSDNELSLTSKGIGSLALAASTVPQSVTLSVLFDGLTRDCEYRPASTLLSSSELREYDFITVPPGSTRPPLASEFSNLKLDRYIRETARVKGTPQASLLAVNSVKRVQQLFLPATILLFKQDDTGEVAASFAVDGRPSEPHEQAFNRADSSLRRRIFAQLKNGYGFRQILTQLPQSVLRRLPASLSRFLGEELDEIQSGNSTERGMGLQADAVDSEGELIGLVPAQELPSRLQDAIQSARLRLLITSESVSGNLFHSRVLDLICSASERGVEVFLGFGLGGPGAGDDEMNLVQSVSNAFKNLPNVRLYFGCNVKTRELVCDDAFAVFTSYDWLGINSGRSFEFNDHTGVLVRDPELVDEVFLKRLALLSGFGVQR